MKDLRRSIPVAALAFVLVVAMTGTAFSEADMVLDVRPGALLIGSASGTFKVRGISQSQLGDLSVIEEAGSLSTLPNMKLGFGWDSPSFYTDLTGDLGVLVNDRFRSIVYGAGGSAQYKYRKNVAVGPHLDLLMFTAPDWSGDAEITFSDTWGLLGGLQMSIGYDVLFIFSIDYLFAQPMDVETQGSWVASDNELDISGLTLQFGMRGKF